MALCAASSTCSRSLVDLNCVMASLSVELMSLSLFAPCDMAFSSASTSSPMNHPMTSFSSRNCRSIVRLRLSWLFGTRTCTERHFQEPRRSSPRSLYRVNVSLNGPYVTPSMHSMGSTRLSTSSSSGHLPVPHRIAPLSADSCRKRLLGLLSLRKPYLNATLPVRIVSTAHCFHG